ncbi:DUF2264 domain-containing protein [Paenibacillus tarimensis]
MLKDRVYWLDMMQRIAYPVLDALSQRKLRRTMPVERKGDGALEFSHLEALGRTLAGIAPWLEKKALNREEEQLRQHYAELARSAINAGTDPESPDFLNFSKGHQPIVDAAFLAHAILRAPNELWHRLEEPVKRNVARALKATRTRKPYFCNWLLFSAMTETALTMMGEEGDLMRIDYALRQHEQWYLGDGMYGDGPEFHADYYNSFVIQPMLIDIIENAGDKEGEWRALKTPILARARKYAAVLERSISPEGTFPVTGRSLAYRTGVFQLLSQIALRRELPDGVKPAQVRCALTEVIRRLIEAPGTFDEAGWLRIGLCGHQPELGEPYISTGSLYLCSTVFLTLGLPEDDEFWSGEEAPWTSQKVWSGQQVPIDKAL